MITLLSSLSSCAKDFTAEYDMLDEEDPRGYSVESKDGTIKFSEKDKKEAPGDKAPKVKHE
jgi:hypothetical protein